jgi:crossover junction endodeoxyribonuclease RusA
MNAFEFLVPRRPLSHQAKNAKHKKEWCDFVYGRAFQEWAGTPISNESLRFTLVYLCEGDPPDINNIVKPVQDALIGLVYSDDNLIVDVQGHLRMTDDLIDVTGLPPLLRDAVVLGADCLYVRIDTSRPLGDLL